MTESSGNEIDKPHGSVLSILKQANGILHHPIITSSGRFKNPWSTWLDVSFFKLLKFIFLSKNDSNVPSSTAKLDSELPIVRVAAETIATPPSQGIRVTWIGHATVLVQFDGISVLTDPLFSNRCSPFSFMGPKRYRPVPMEIHDLPPNLDAVVISHNHYDHLDYPTVKSLNSKLVIRLLKLNK